MRFSLILLALGLSLPALADWTALSSTEFSLKPPPKEGSSAYIRDFSILLKEQSTRTEEECALALHQASPSFQTMYEDSGLLTKQESRKVGTLVEKAMEVTQRISSYFKNKFKRPRPYDVDSNIEPCVEKIGGAKAYPSSHASMSAIAACLLAEIFPNRAPKILAYGEYLGQLRVKVGLHHPSDVEAGAKLAEDICVRLHEETDFREQIEALKE